MKRKITDKTAGLTNVLPMRIAYTFSDREMTTDQIIAEILKQKSTKTFNLSSLKETLKSFGGNPQPKHLDEFAFLAKHIAGAGYVLIKVIYHKPQKKERNERFIIKEVMYNDSKWKKGVFIAHGYD